MSNKGRRAIAIVGLCFMAIFSVSLCLVLADRTLLGGAFGWIALCSGLLGVAAFLVVKFVVKDTNTPFDAKKGPPPYLPVPDEGEADGEDAQPENTAEERGEPDKKLTVEDEKSEPDEKTAP